MEPDLAELFKEARNASDGIRVNLRPSAPCLCMVVLGSVHRRPPRTLS